MSRIVIVILIYHDHKPIELSMKCIIYMSHTHAGKCVLIFFCVRWIMACGTCMGVFGQAITHAVGTV
jgi:hypothetical protein